MDLKITVISLVLLCVQVIHGDVTDTVDGVTIKVKGQSGKMDLTRDNNTCTIEMSEMKERDENGNEVGKTGNIKHSFNSFASQTFSFSQFVDAQYQDIDARKVTFNAELIDGAANLDVELYMFKEDGNYTNGEVSADVKEGMMKFSIKLTNWQFCGDVTCKKGNTDEVGKYVDFAMNIKCKGDAKKHSEQGDQAVFDMGGAKMILEQQVKNGDNWETMASGYPNMETQGSKQIFTFRFPKGDNLLYDPAFEMEDEGTGGSMGLTMSLCSMLLALLAAYIF